MSELADKWEALESAMRACGTAQLVRDRLSEVRVVLGAQKPSEPDCDHDWVPPTMPHVWRCRKCGVGRDASSIEWLDLDSLSLRADSFPAAEKDDE